MVLGRDKSTLSRELKRNKGERGYRPRQAQEKSEARARTCANGRRVPEDAWVYVDEKLKLDWSPEQITGRMAYEGLETVSHETIYQHVYADKAEGGELYRHLRCQKQRRKRYGSGQSRRGKIPNRVCIEQRPEVVDAKSRAGDWEGDTIIGAGQSQAIASVVERKFQEFESVQLINSAWLLKQLQEANQRQHYAASLELALTDPARRLYYIHTSVKFSYF